MRRLAALIGLAPALLGCSSEEHDPPVLPKGPPLALVEVVSGLDSPTQVIAPRSERDRLYVVEQDGRVLVLNGSKLRREPFLDIRHLVKSGGEQGLLSLAFHPDYAENGLLYVHHSNREGHTRVVEYRADGERVVRGSRRVLLAVDQPYDNHNGGQLAFGPDGLLYLGLGDGGAADDPEGRSQDPGTRLGKLLRLDVDGPRARWEIVAIGLRNPWRFSFDEETGVLYIGDVGQNEWEEIDAVPTPIEGVLNFGWDVYEGFERFEDKEPTPGAELVEPLSVYSHAEGCSVIGGMLYRGDEVPPLRGRYLYGDYCSGTVWSFRVREGKAVERRIERIKVPLLTSIGLDSDGEIYLVSQQGTIFRIAER